jgi:hypothetical protein
MNPESSDPLLSLLVRLPTAEPSSISVARGRARAHAILARKRREVNTPASGRRLPAFETALFLVSAAYLAGAIGMALRLARLS